MAKELEKIYVVFKTHFDIGFTGLVSDVVHRYRHEMLDDVLNICEQTSTNQENEKYVWTMSAWPLQQSLEGSGHENYERALKVLEQKQLVWHMLPYTTHTEFCGLEEWIRGMYISRTLSEKYGYYPKAAKMTDVPGHTWIVPSLLKKAGVKFLHLGCNPASTPPDVPDLFWWEGPDGERLLTYYSKGQYGTGILPPEEWQHPVWLAMIQTGDNHGAHEASIIEEMKREIDASDCNAKLHIGTLQDFAEDLLARNPELPIVRGDLADAWIHGVGTAPKEVARVRQLRSRITSTESVISLLSVNQVISKQAALELKREVTAAYENALHFGEHTWGMDCKTFLFPRRYLKHQFLEDKQTERYQLMEKSWQEQRDYLNTAELATQKVISTLTELVEGDSLAKSDSITGEALLVTNSLGWKRDVEITLQPNHHYQYVEECSGEPVATRMEHGERKLCVKDVPAVGYKRLLPVAETNINQPPNLEEQSDIVFTDQEHDLMIENEFLLLKMHKSTGSILSIWDKEFKHEYVDQNSDYHFGQFEYNIYSNIEITRYLKKYGYRFYDWGIYDFGKIDYPEHIKRQQFTPKEVTIKIEQGEHYITLTATSEGDSISVEQYGNAKSMSWSITMYANQRELDYRFNMKDKQETPLAESGSIVFPLNIDKANYRMNKLGVVLDPLKDTVKGSSTLLHCCESFVDTTNDSFSVGLAIIPLDSPLFFIGRNGMWDYEAEHIPNKPEFHFNIFNNWWGTNFPQWIGGELNFAFKLIPHAGAWSEAKLWKRAEEVRCDQVVLSQSYPVKTQQVEPYSAEISDLSYFSVLSEDLKDASVLSYKQAEDGQGYIIRIRDWSGQARKLAIHLHERVQTATLTDLLEYDIHPLDIAQSEISQWIEVDNKPFDVHTIRLQW